MEIQTTALDIPEIRQMLSRFLSIADAIVCIRVSKSWYKDFIHLIWYSVNLKTQKKFMDLHITTIHLFGHHIRVVENVATEEHLHALLSPNIKNLQRLLMTCPRNARFRALSMDLIGNNSRSLTSLTLEMYQRSSRQDLLSRIIPVDTLAPLSSSSRLSFIRFHGICMSRGAFISLLRGCPLLVTIDLQQTALLSGPFIDAFQHVGVKNLTAPIKQVFKPDPESAPLPVGSSLLVHFPNLTRWDIYHTGKSLIVPVERIKTEARLCCPNVAHIDTWITARPVLYDLVVNVFDNLISVAFSYEELSADIVLGILRHTMTLTNISGYWSGSRSLTERDDFLPEDDPFQSHGRLLQLLPAICSNLTVIEFESHVMSMDFVDERDWICMGLQQLRIRVQGLDTKHKIDKALDMWTDGKNSNDKEPPARTSLYDSYDTYIATRLARHLLKFEKLNSVWLGTRTRTISTGA